MTRARWLGLTEARAPHAVQTSGQPRARWRDWLLNVAIAVALGAGIGAVLLASARALDHDLRSAPALRLVALEPGCAPPTEYEQLHVVIIRRGERLIPACQYVGPRGAFHRTPHGMPGVRP